MNNELAKTISTTAVWLSIACILTFGIFKMNVNGYMVVFLVEFCLPAFIVGAAVKATSEIWKPHPMALPPQGTPPALGVANPAGGK